MIARTEEGLTELPEHDPGAAEARQEPLHPRLPHVQPRLARRPRHPLHAENLRNHRPLRPGAPEKAGARSGVWTFPTKTRPGARRT